MSHKAVVIFLITVLHLLQLDSQAQCINGQNAIEYRSSVSYKEHTEKGMLTDAQWDKAIGLVSTYLKVPYIEGFLETSLIKNWKLVDITGARPADAVIVAVNSNGQSGHVFFADYSFVKKNDLLKDRIRKIDLKFYNNMLRSEARTIESPSQALDISLVLLKAATYRARGFFIQVINNASDIPKPSDEKRRFSGIVRDPSDESSATDFRLKIKRLTSTVVPPHYSKRNGEFKLSFFTWDPVFGDVEHWCLTVTSTSVRIDSRKLVSSRV